MARKKPLPGQGNLFNVNQGAPIVGQRWDKFADWRPMDWYCQCCGEALRGTLDDPAERFGRYRFDITDSDFTYLHVKCLERYGRLLAEIKEAA